MNPTPESLSAALDAALSRSLTPPVVPRHFRTSLRAAMQRLEVTDIGALRARYEQEQAQQLEALQRHYVRLKRRTLGLMVVGAFAAGGAAALAMPWFTLHLGSMAPFAVACCGAAAGLGIAYRAWRRRDAFET